MLVTAEDGKILQHKINKAMEELHSCFYTNNLRIKCREDNGNNFSYQTNKSSIKTTNQIGHFGYCI
jgi:hypothetical protein